MKRAPDHHHFRDRSRMTGQPARASSPGRLLYSVEEAAELLGIGRTFMFHLVASGEIESFKIGNRRKIHREAIDAYVNRLRAEQLAAADGPADFQLRQDQRGSTA
jgi:excisionase family DNA binding protein